MAAGLQDPNCRLGVRGLAGVRRAGQRRRFVGQTETGSRTGLDHRQSELGVNGGAGEDRPVNVACGQNRAAGRVDDGGGDDHMSGFDARAASDFDAKRLHDEAPGK